ncbi:hypothetical protein VPHD445_0097 [Vibrio phage D445]
MSRLTTVLSVNVPRHNDITGMCLIGCNGKTSLCVYCYWGVQVYILQCVTQSQTTVSASLKNCMNKY